MLLQDDRYMSARPRNSSSLVKINKNDPGKTELFRCRSVSASGLGLRNGTGLCDGKIIKRLFS